MVGPTSPSIADPTYPSELSLTQSLPSPEAIPPPPVTFRVTLCWGGTCTPPPQPFPSPEPATYQTLVCRSPSFRRLSLSTSPPSPLGQVSIVEFPLNFSYSVFSQEPGARSPSSRGQGLHVLHSGALAPVQCLVDRRILASSGPRSVRVQLFNFFFFNLAL